MELSGALESLQALWHLAMLSAKGTLRMWPLTPPAPCKKRKERGTLNLIFIA